MSFDPTNFAIDAIAKHVGGVASFSMPVLTHKLYVSNPTISGGGTECSDASYSGQTCPFTWDGANINIKSTNALSYGGSTGFAGSVTIVGEALVDGSGNMWYFKVLGSSISISAGELLDFDAGAITVSVNEATFTDYARQQLLKHIGNITSLTMPALKQAVFTTAPTYTTGGTESSDSNYTPQTVTFSFASHAVSNSAVVTLGGTTGFNANATIVAEGLKDGSGNVWSFKALSVTINAGKRYKFLTGSITLTPS